MAGSDRRKQSLYFPEEMLEEIHESAHRQDRSLSWVVQQAWRIALERIKALPSSNDFTGEDALRDPPEEDFEDRWAGALIASLMTDGKLQMKPGKEFPIGWVSNSLARQSGKQLAACVLEALVDAPEVEEVFVDEGELARRIRAMRPGK
jgi:uncharacterized small protein (TIGR04563 family)